MAVVEPGALRLIVEPDEINYKFRFLEQASHGKEFTLAISAHN
jgi:hypothetical protein